MECANAMAKGEIHAFNEGRRDDAGETQFAQLLPDVAERTAKRAWEGGNEPTSARGF